MDIAGPGPHVSQIKPIVESILELMLGQCQTNLDCFLGKLWVYVVVQCFRWVASFRGTSQGRSFYSSKCPFKASVLGFLFFHSKLCFFSPLFRDFLLDENFPETIRKFSFFFSSKKASDAFGLWGSKAFLVNLGAMWMLSNNG